MRRLQILTLAGILVSSLFAEDRVPIASWLFDGPGTDEVRGFHKFVDGVAGKALRFDGQTTTVVRSAVKNPRIDGPFSVEARVALQTYPWTWCAVSALARPGQRPTERVRRAITWRRALRERPPAS